MAAGNRKEIARWTAALGLLLLTACGGGSGGTTTTTTTTTTGTGGGTTTDSGVSLSLTGPSGIAASGSALVTATVTSSTSASVTWSVDGIAGGNATVGTILAPVAGNTAVYTAPATAGSHVIKAASASDTTLTGTVTLTVASTALQASAFTVGANVKSSPYNAKGDGSTDDTAAIMAAVQAVKGTGKAVVIPSGTYRIDPTANSGVGLVLGSNMTLILESGAVLQALSTSTAHYEMIRLSGCQNVNILGGTVKGNNGNNTIVTPTTVEDGNGIEILNSSNIVVEGTTFQDCFCDGVYIATGSTNVTLSGITSRDNRRNGLSIVKATYVNVVKSTFSANTGSVEVAGGAVISGSGIDLEPNAGDTVSGILVAGCSLVDNPSCGLSWGIGAASASGTTTAKIFVMGNTVTGNAFGLNAVNCSDSAIVGNTVGANTECGIYIHDGATRTACTGNTVTGTGSDGDGAGIECYNDTTSVVNANTSTGNYRYGVLAVGSTSPTITNNVLTGNGTVGLRVTNSTGVTSSGNTQ